MIRIARDIWPTWYPDRPAPDDDSATVRGVLDAIAVEHADRDDILDFCRAELGRIETFCRDRDVIGLAEEPLEIRWTPVFLRSFGGAMLDSPGPLDKGQKAFFSVTPIPDEWTPEQAESYLREDNDRMLRLLTIHEAVPGHYLQGVYANRCPSLARTIFWSGVFAEGWAVYVTQVMMDLGFGADDPALLLNHWKFYLRAVTNAMIDIGIHTAWHDRGPGGFAHGRRRLPGGGRGSRQVRPGAVVIDAALHVFRRLDGDVGPRPRTSPGVGRGVGRSAGRRRGPRAAGRRRLRRHAGIRLPHAPRGCRRARRTADPAAPQARSRLTYEGGGDREPCEAFDDEPAGAGVRTGSAVSIAARTRSTR